jgi:hypothetical protein
MLPKNETINKAIDEDNKDSIIHDRIEAAKEESKELTMGAALVSKPEATEAEVVEETPATTPTVVPSTAEESPAKKAMREAMEKAKTENK